MQTQALFQVARTRPWLAVVVLAGAAVATTATGVVTHQVELHSTVAPLAPAPPPPAGPAAFLRVRPHLIPRLKVNPLAGLASWYGSVWNGRKTASGEEFDESLLTAAHKTLPLGTLVRVTNLRSMRSVIVRINDRGALSPSRVIDLSSAAAREIGMVSQGLARVRLEILGKS